jgi:hypothetical protein
MWNSEFRLRFCARVFRGNLNNVMRGGEFPLRVRVCVFRRSFNNVLGSRRFWFRCGRIDFWALRHMTLRV